MSQITIPRNTKAASLAWGQTFVAALEGSPGLYGVDVAVVGQLRTLVDLFQADWDDFGVTNRLANDPNLYTKPGRAALSTSASNFMGLASQTAVQIQADNSVSDMDKLAAGVQPRNFTRTPVPPPATIPLIDVVFSTSGVHQLEYADTTTPSSRRKPSGVIQIQLFSTITDLATPGQLVNAKLVGQFTKAPIVVAHDPTDNGMLATYWARWVNRKGEAGNFSGAVASTISFTS